MVTRVDIDMGISTPYDPNLVLLSVDIDWSTHVQSNSLDKVLTDQCIISGCRTGHGLVKSWRDCFVSKIIPLHKVSTEIAGQHIKKVMHSQPACS